MVVKKFIILIVRITHIMIILCVTTLILTTKVLKKNTLTPSNSCLTLASSNIKSVSKHFETFQIDINKLKYNILGLSETCLSSDIEMLHHVPLFVLFTSNRSIIGGGVLLYVRDTFDANKLVNFSVVLEHL